MVRHGEINSSLNFYLPHHCVLKEDSTTTKLRVVFDASALVTIGFSPNDCLLVGPKSKMICSKFSFPFEVILSVFVAEMYQQNELDKADRDSNWTLTSEGPVEILRMTRVTNSIASSFNPVFARIIANLLEVPTEVQRALLRDCYVDDILTGANSIDEARILRKQSLETRNDKDSIFTSGFERIKRKFESNFELWTIFQTKTIQ